jgi:hypothetical protein
MFRKNVKYLVIGLIIDCFMFAVIPIFASVNMNKIDVLYNNIKIQINGKLIDTGDDKPFIYNGRTYVPARYVAQELGATVKWNETSGIIEIDQNKVVSAPTITSNIALENKVVTESSITPLVIKDKFSVTLNKNPIGEIESSQIINNEVYMSRFQMFDNIKGDNDLQWYAPETKILLVKIKNIDLTMDFLNHTYILNNEKHIFDLNINVLNDKLFPAKFIFEKIFSGNVNINIVTKVITINI